MDVPNPPKTILSIQSQVANSRVGNSVAAFAMERLGVRVWQMPTTLLGRRPDRGPPGGGPLPAETLSSLFEGIAADGRLGEVDAVLTGYIGDAEQAPVILDAVQRVKEANPSAIFACDPVLGDDGKLYVSDSIADAIVNGLAPNADWLLPNAFELGVILGTAVERVEQARDAARRFGRPVLVSSLKGPQSVVNLYTSGAGDWCCETPRLPHSPKGAGDLLSAVFLARRVLGDTPAIALEGATGSVFDVIVRSLAAESEDLLLPGAQDLIREPVTWPACRPLEPL